MARNGRHAVVLGGSMAGLLTARALSAHFERVTLIERDHFPSDADHRKGVPQSRHAHGLLASGYLVILQGAESALAHAQRTLAQPLA